MKSWKTTAAGIAAGIAIILPQIQLFLAENGGFGEIDWKIVVTGLGAMGIGWFSRDNNVSSENAGAK